MKFASKRRATGWMALAAVVVGFLPLSVRAGENGYALHFARDAYVCAAPFVADYTVTGENGKAVFSGENFVEVYHLTADWAEDGQDVSIAAYSADAAAGVPGNTAYRRVGLEDSGYFSSGTAGKIRAVVLASYPRRDPASIQTNANLWLQSHGLPELQHLQSGEAVLAAQLTIWQLTNEGCFTVNRYLSGWKDMTTPGWRKYLEKVADPDTACQQPTDATAWNVEGLCQYLSSLGPAAPGCETVSDAALENPVYSAVQEADGTYTVTVSVDIRTTVEEQDALTLSASCGGQIKTQPVTGAGSCSVSFSDLTDRPEVTLEITGTQHGGDVYLFEGEKQRLVGFDDSVLPVHGQLLVKPDCILNIFDSTEDSGIPLANVRFDLYRVATQAQLESGEFSLNQLPAGEELKACQTPGNLVTILTTDFRGLACYNFTANSQPEGVYLVSERANAATLGTSAPFFLVVPGVSADGGNAYTLNVKPTNTVETGPGVETNVAETGCVSGSFDAGQSHTWILRGDVPAGIATAQKYVITATIDSRLVLEEESPAVTLLTRGGTEINLTEGDHYTLTGSETVPKIQVSLTPAGMAYTAANLGDGESSPEIRVRFQAAIREGVELGVPISGKTALSYLNCVGISYEAESGGAEVHTGGIRLRVTDETGQALSGASFKLARPAEQTDTDGSGVALKLEGTQADAVFMDFLTEDGGQRVSEVTTGEDGTAFLRGLAYGQYYLVQTKAPEGSCQLKYPVAVTVNASSHLTARDGWLDANGTRVDNTVELVNTEVYLPETGDVGAAVFVVAGSTLIGMVCVAMFEMILQTMKRRSRR